MQTKRRYAHELYPHAEDEYAVRPLSVEVPYLYARAIGFEVRGTGWFDLPIATPQGAQLSSGRTLYLLAMRERAVLADAIHQGLTGDEAWEWAKGRYDEAGEWIYERAIHYGVKPELIKPYPCGDVPDQHDHMSSTGDITGQGIVTRINCREDECPACCEPVGGEPA